MGWWALGDGDERLCPLWAEPDPSLVLSSECKIEHCEACFSHNFCTKCQEGLYLHKGRCYPACPEGSTAANGTMECSSPGKLLGAAGRGPQALGRGAGGALYRESFPTTHISWDSSEAFTALWTKDALA
jgi:hypothetical protein